MNPCYCLLQPELPLKGNAVARPRFRFGLARAPHEPPTSGGSELVGFDRTHDGLRVRYGNGVEFGPNCQDAIVERCTFFGVYDVAFTMQGSPTVTSWSDIHMRDCLVRDSSQAFEIWCKGARPGIGFERCSFTGNRTVNVGGGWGALVRPNRHTATPLLVYDMETDTVDIDVSGNTFVNATRGLARGEEDRLDEKCS